MIVCHCHAVSDRQITAAVAEGAHDVDEVGERCGAGTDCFGCHERIEAILSEACVLEPMLRAS
jgi:bacterioferritin-associated ferredoxin